MRHPSKRESTYALSGLFRSALSRRYTIPQAKWAIREVLELQNGFSPAALNARASNLCWHDMFGVLAERCRPLTEDMHDAYVRYVRRTNEAILTSLGEWSEDIAEYLAKEGILGTPESACDCPVARWLTVHTEAWAIQVASSVICIDGVELDTPPNVAKFIRRFDMREFSDLLALPADLRV